VAPRLGAHPLGKAVQVNPMKPVLNPPETKRLRPKHDELLWSFAYNFNLRRYCWGQEIKQSIGEAEIIIASENPYQGTGQYFSRLARAYRPGDAGNSEGFPVTCVNLLRCAPGKPELLLSEHFHEVGFDR